VPVTGIVAIGLGVAVAAVAGLVAHGADAETDPSMVWEARVAAGFTALVAGAPFWLAQLVLTLVATIHSGATGWLWLWWVAAPALGAMLGAALGDVTRRGSRGAP
jgi:hypothetical protein